jgi:alkylation response protein AidB-like acyl-CoA dehydrogenase
MTDLLYSDTETALREAVRSLLADRLTPQDVIDRYDKPEPDGTGLWAALGTELGVTGLLVPEQHGGHGVEAREAAVVQEELGRQVAPVPFLTSAVIATTCLAAAGDSELLPALAAATATAVLCTPLTATTEAPTVSRGADGLITGTVSTVPDAAAATVLLVSVEGRGSVELHAIEAGAPGVHCAPVPSLDMSRPLADVTFGGATSRVVTDDAAGALRQGLLAGAALLASEQLGVAEWCLDTTVAYLRGRYQFGRPLGSFQALKHRLADLLVEVTTARAAARYAADCLATGDPDLDVAASLAQAHCSGVAVRAAEECVQLHGGIGMTWEYPAHLYLKRAKADELALGTPAMHRARIARLIDIPSG